MFEYYDTHSHLNDEPYDDEINDYFVFLKENKIYTNVIGCDWESSIKAVEYAKKQPNNIKACVGIHPNDVKRYENDKDIFDKLKKLVENNLSHIVAIGEIGLDLHYEKENLSLQQYFCREQIKIATEFNLPIMFHIRDAFEEIKPIIVENKNHKKIIHCFTNDIEQAKFYITNNCLISIPGVLTFKNAILVQDAIKEIDIKYLVCETDSPYLTPVPFRGKKNYPHYVQYVYQKIAELKNMDIDVVKKTINKTAFDFFNLKY